MKSFTFSRLYAASLIGLGAVAVVVACDPGTDMPGTQLDMTATSDMTVASDMTMFDGPTVTSVSPAVGANNATTNVTITGSNFRAGAAVTVAGVACGNVMVTSATTITCTVPAKAATCGAQDIVVTHPDDGKSGTGVKLFTYRSSGTASWANLVSYPTAAGPRRVLIGDFNADNKLDLVTVNQTGNNITLKTGLGDGTFPSGASQNIAIGAGATGPSDLAMGDFNGDNRPDIVTVNNSNNISVLTNQGGTVFNASVITTTGFTTGMGGSIAVGDITGETGPCGPCTEIHVDLTPEDRTPELEKRGAKMVNSGDARCIEIWNLVFIQFNANPDGTFAPLPAQHVDTGMGFERVTSILQGTRNLTDFANAKISNYETDIFRPIFDELEKLSGKKYGSTLPPADLSTIDSQQSADIAFRAGVLPIVGLSLTSKIADKMRCRLSP